MSARRAVHSREKQKQRAIEEYRRKKIEEENEQQRMRAYLDMHMTSPDEMRVQATGAVFLVLSMTAAFSAYFLWIKPIPLPRLPRSVIGGVIGTIMGIFIVNHNYKINIKVKADTLIAEYKALKAREEFFRDQQ